MVDQSREVADSDFDDESAGSELGQRLADDTQPPSTSPEPPPPPPSTPPT